MLHLSEFSANGLAGARTEQIAAAAGVNKALLYYYFESKEKLYAAALEMVAARVRDRSMAVFLREGEPGRAHAAGGAGSLRSDSDAAGVPEPDAAGDDAAAQRAKRERCRILVKRVFGPLHAMFQSMVREGVASGELIEADWLQIVLAALGGECLLFSERAGMAADDALRAARSGGAARRRVALVEFLGQAMFIDRKHGAETGGKSSGRFAHAGQK